MRQSAIDDTNLILAFATGDQLLIEGAAGTGAFPTIEFADGVEWDQAELIQQSIESQIAQR